MQNNNIDIQKKLLIKNALEAQKKAYSPYSNFSVGACLLASNGKMFSGCNVESVSFAPTICAERTAIVKAVSEGVKDFLAIAVVGKKMDELEENIGYISPCGVCRQTMLEFCKKDFKIILAKNENDFKEYTLSEIMPVSFDPKELL